MKFFTLSKAGSRFWWTANGMKWVPAVPLSCRAASCTRSRTLVISLSNATHHSARRTRHVADHANRCRAPNLFSAGLNTASAAMAGWVYSNFASRLIWDTNFTNWHEGNLQRDFWQIVIVRLVKIRVISVWPLPLQQLGFEIDLRAGESNWDRTSLFC